MVRARASFGDEGCFQLFHQNVLSISNRTRCVPLTISESEGKLFSRQPGAGPRSRAEWDPGAYDYVVLGGGSLLNADRYVKALEIAQDAGVPTAIWGTGFDGLPHELASHLAGGEGLPADQDEVAPLPHPSLPDVLRRCRAAGVRGPLTAAWLEVNGCDSPPIFGDPGLLLRPLDSGSPSPRDQATVIWGVSHRATHQGPSHEELTRSIARWLKSISDRYRPAICVMWAHDLPAARQLAREVGPGAKLLEAPLTLTSFGRLISRTAFTVSYRLHGCIFSAACGVPFCSIAYRSKCYDFALSIDAGEWVVDPASSDFETRLGNWLTQFAGPERTSIPDQLRRHTLPYRESLLGIVQTIIRELEEGQSCQNEHPR